MRLYLVSLFFLFGCSWLEAEEDPWVAPAAEAPAADPDAPCVSGLTPGLHTLSTGRKKNQMRAYHVYVPASVTPNPPVVVVLHGAGGSAEKTEGTMKFQPVADTHGFIIVAPEGDGAKDDSLSGWNAGHCCGPAYEEDVDDVGFIRDILTDLEHETCYDTRRVYAVGHSNGGMLAYRLACELSDRITAISTSAAFLLDEDHSRFPPKRMFECAPERPVPILHMHGLADRCANFEGGLSEGPGEQVWPAARDVVEKWAERNACPSPPTTTYTKQTARCEAWLGCAENSEVVLCTDSRAGHAWPGRPRPRRHPRAPKAPSHARRLRWRRPHRQQRADGA